MRRLSLRPLARLNGWVVLAALALALIGVAFIRSTTLETRFAGQHLRQLAFLAVSAGVALVAVVLPPARLRRISWPVYVAVVLALALLPVFGDRINGARRWYAFPGFSLQPSEFAKPALILALASWLRFRHKARTTEGLLVPMAITAVPVVLVLAQPDLSSSLVFWPVLLAMCYAAGTPGKTLLGVMGVGAAIAGIGFGFLHAYQRQRLDVWWAHDGWTEAALADPVTGPEIRKLLADAAYQPWQSLIAIGGGGVDGFGLQAGPQNQGDFLPYRSVDYIWSVIAEEAGFLGAAAVLLLHCGLVWGLLRMGMQVRERFGRLVCVGVATWIGTQTLAHAAVCLWLMPATGLPMPLISYGGSSTLAVVVGLGFALHAGAQREPVLAPDGFG